MVHSIVDMSIMVIVQPPGLNWQKPRINPLQTPVYFLYLCTVRIVVNETGICLFNKVDLDQGRRMDEYNLLEDHLKVG